MAALVLYRFNWKAFPKSMASRGPLVYGVIRAPPPDSDDEELSRMGEPKGKRGRNLHQTDWCKVQRYCLAGVIFIFIALVCYLALRGD